MVIFEFNDNFATSSTNSMYELQDFSIYSDFRWVWTTSNVVTDRSSVYINILISFAGCLGFLQLFSVKPLMAVYGG